jgi:hypothetical protein
MAWGKVNAGNVLLSIIAVNMYTARKVKLDDRFDLLLFVRGAGRVAVGLSGR